MSVNGHKLPDPLMPAEVSPMGNTWFPFKFERIPKSRWWRRASDMARARNVMLWGPAYASDVPGSLPNDDDELADLAGFGVDTEAFRAAKPEIMSCWVLCSDGRWYHPTVCEVVLEAWDRLSSARKLGAERQRARRLRLKSVTRDSGKLQGESKRAAPKKRHAESRVTQPKNDDVTRDLTRARPDTEHNNTKKKGVSNETPVIAKNDDEGVEPQNAGDPVNAAFDAYNQLAQEIGLPVAKVLTRERRASLMARLKQHGLGGWLAALAEVRAAPFLCGATPKKFRADLDFLLQAKSFNRTIEGFYERIDTERPRTEQRGDAARANLERAFRTPAARSGSA